MELRWYLVPYAVPRDLTADIVAVIIILFGIGVQLGLEYWKKQERDKLTGKEVALSVTIGEDMPLSYLHTIGLLDSSNTD